MTEDQNSYPGSTGPLEEQGRAYEEAVEHEALTDVDYDDNVLHATGRTCLRCGRVIRPQDDVRRTASGGYEHEFCKVSVDPGPGAVPPASPTDR